MHVGFQEKQCFLLMGCDSLLLINDIIVFVSLVLSEDLKSVNLKLELYMYVCAECDLLMILLLIILIYMR